MAIRAIFHAHKYDRVLRFLSPYMWLSRVIHLSHELFIMRDFPVKSHLKGIKRALFLIFFESTTSIIFSPALISLPTFCFCFSLSLYLYFSVFPLCFVFFLSLSLYFTLTFFFLLLASFPFLSIFSIRITRLLSKC